jgi:hypothetical protein
VQSISYILWDDNLIFRRNSNGIHDNLLIDIIFVLQYHHRYHFVTLQANALFSQRLSSAVKYVSGLKQLCMPGMGMDLSVLSLRPKGLWGDPLSPRLPPSPKTMAGQDGVVESLLNMNPANQEYIRSQEKADMLQEKLTP